MKYMRSIVAAFVTAALIAGLFLVAGSHTAQAAQRFWAPLNDVPAGGTEGLVEDRYTLYLDQNEYHIPVINIDSEDVSRINDEIYAWLFDDIQSSSDFYEKEGTVYELFHAGYETFVSDDILSLIVNKRFIGPWNEYKVYNISISSGKQLNDEELLSAAGFTQEEYLEQLKKQSELAYWTANYRQQDSSFDNAITSYESEKQKTLEEENLKEGMPYINQDGQLCVLARIYYFMAQNSYGWQKLNLNEYPLDNGYYVFVAAPDDYCNLRTGAGTNYDIIQPIYNDVLLYITEEYENPDDGLLWGKTDFYGAEGWVSLSQTTNATPDITQ